MITTSEVKLLQQIAHTTRALCADAIELQKSGHPGMCLGAAEICTYLFAKVLKHNPENPRWINRDRFVLSAGHGSMLLYSLLHLSGYNISLNDIKNFRQLHSQTPGHPELNLDIGVEVTTGPLGQGLAAATGMAMAHKMTGARFGETLFDSKIWVLAGDGCMMEGVAAEAASLAGTLGLSNLVIIYDSNGISLDGPTDECFLENTKQRYEAYGFLVREIDGYHFGQMEKAFSEARSESDRPVLIVAKTIIGKYAPTMQGSHTSHGNFLGPDEIRGFKDAIGWPQHPLFYVPQEVSSYFKERRLTLKQCEDQWERQFENKVLSNPEIVNAWDIFTQKKLPDHFEETLWNIDIKPNQSLRKYNESIIPRIAELLPYFISGSADLGSCDITHLPGAKILQKNKWCHQQIKFGVREFAMACCAYGMTIHGLFQPLIGTFLTFSDYMRNAIRMAAMMKQRVIFAFSHDSILLGQDGPSHQPVEHLMSLRLIPNLVLMRPGDENEMKAAWSHAFSIQNQPVIICYSRQVVPSTVSDLTRRAALVGVKKGAYLLYGESSETSDIKIFATGTEIHPAVGAAKLLENDGYKVCVISVISWEEFEKQPPSYRKTLLRYPDKLSVSVEAGCGLGWQKFVGNEGLIISQETFGASAPEGVLADHFGFTSEKVYEQITGSLEQSLSINKYEKVKKRRSMITNL
ncbi:transketolase [Planctomycetota bacterium]